MASSIQSKLIGNPKSKTYLQVSQSENSTWKEKSTPQLIIFFVVRDNGSQISDPHSPHSIKNPSPFPHHHSHFFLLQFIAETMTNKRRTRARKSRLSKPKKPKFLSLRRQFPPDHAAAAAAATSTDSRQLDLFPLHPEHDREIEDQANNVALFFSSTDGGATTLTDLLDNSSAVDSNSTHTNNDSSGAEHWAAVVRRALRSRDRDSSEEKWVRYSEVVKEEEVSSSVQRVSLKLDYQEIINAWSDKGSLFVDAQIVPDPSLSNHEVSGWGNNGGMWTVPEIEMKDMSSIGQRKASVLRYKEKRQNRLFSKKIRYQVRKLNAEKRPRLKGRFVKKN